MFHPRGPTFFELARQAMSSTETGYDLLAPKFDYTPFRTPGFVLKGVKDRLAGEDFAGKSALDLCSGTGAAMQMMLDLGCADVCGVDFSQGMIDQAKENLTVSDESQTIRFKRTDVLDPGFQSEFDFAVSFGAFGHILPKQERQFVRVISDALKPGGKFIFVTTPMLPLWSPGYWLSRGFNGAMRIRNFLFKPEFIMYYLTFLWPDIQKHFESASMQAEAVPLFPDQRRFKYLLMVTATKNS